MPLRKFAVRNYRCFPNPQELEIAPVTVVLGKNNSGKSALVRTPLVLATGFGVDTTAPLDLERLEVNPVDAFTDLIFGHSEHGSISFEIDVGGQAPFRMSVTVQHISETRDAVVSDLGVLLDDVDIQLRWQQSLMSANAPRDYEIHVDGRFVRRGPVEFRGLLPVEGSVAELRKRFPGTSPLGAIRYLSSYRERLPRQHRLPLGSPRRVGAQGEGVSAVLAHDRARGRGEVITKVNSYLEQIVPDWMLKEVPVGPLYATVLVRRSDDAVQVNLADAGAGLAQVLPILVQCALDEEYAGPGEAPLQIIEEPEMHLHPAVHAELADLYVRTARTTGTRFLIETHSETLLLRLRRRVAEESVPAEMVGVWVVDQRDGVSSVRRVDVDDLGNLGENWPEGYFSTDYQEARALAAAQLQRGSDAA
jgi:hypothetical protein